MADPTVTEIDSGSAQGTSITPTWTAEPTDTLLVLAIDSSGQVSATPTGWTASTGYEQSNWSVVYLFWKLSNGSETSVTVNFAGSYNTVWSVVSASNIASTGTLDVSNGQGVDGPSGGDGVSYTSPSVTTASGRRLAVGVLGFQNDGTNFTGVDTWINSYTEASQNVYTDGKQALGVGTLAFDGGGSTQAGCDPTGQGYQSAGGIVNVFVVDSGTTVTHTGTNAVTAAAVAPDVGAALTITATTHLT